MNAYEINLRFVKSFLIESEDKPNIG